MQVTKSNYLYYMIVGIGGISRSGKSFLAEQLQHAFEARDYSVKVLSQDDFVFPEEQIPKINGHVDWEIPESIDFEAFIEAIKAANHRCDLILLEGLMLFWNSDLLKLLDLCVFIELGKELFVQRKQLDLRWGKEPDWYIEYIWKSYLIYGQLPANVLPELLLDGSRPFDIKQVVHLIQKKL